MSTRHLKILCTQNSPGLFDVANPNSRKGGHRCSLNYVQTIWDFDDMYPSGSLPSDILQSSTRPGLSNSIPRPSYGKHFKNNTRVLAILHPDATRNVVVCNSSEYPILMLWDSTAETV
jgi:hypothetical protein